MKKAYISGEKECPDEKTMDAGSGSGMTEVSNTLSTHLEKNPYTHCATKSCFG